MHTIRLREEMAYVRLSDLLRGAPLQVLEAVAAILLARLYRRGVPKALLEIYRSYSLAHSTRRRLTRVRRKRARRMQILLQGNCYDLARLFGSLNRHYFANGLSQPHLAWSRRPWRTQLGCFDPALKQIVLNCRLDRAIVPVSAVEYVLFHEMLHMKHPIRRVACGLRSHSREFRREEKRFAEYDRARRWLARLA
jgi:hypothetical protein